MIRRTKLNLLKDEYIESKKKLLYYKQKHMFDEYNREKVRHDKISDLIDELLVY